MARPHYRSQRLAYRKEQRDAWRNRRDWSHPLDQDLYTEAIRHDRLEAMQEIPRPQSQEGNADE
jgi:hypothetical protein